MGRRPWLVCRGARLRRGGGTWRAATRVSGRSGALFSADQPLAALLIPLARVPFPAAFRWAFRGRRGRGRRSLCRRGRGRGRRGRRSLCRRGRGRGRRGRRSLCRRGRGRRTDTETAADVLYTATSAANESWRATSLSSTLAATCNTKFFFHAAGLVSLAGVSRLAARPLRARVLIKAEHSGGGYCRASQQGSKHFATGRSRGQSSCCSIEGLVIHLYHSLSSAALTLGTSCPHMGLCWTDHPAR